MLLRRSLVLLRGSLALLRGSLILNRSVLLPYISLLTDRLMGRLVARSSSRLLPRGLCGSTYRGVNWCPPFTGGSRSEALRALIDYRGSQW